MENLLRGPAQKLERPRSLTDHEKAMHPGGAKKTRGRKRNESNLTVAGPLAALADLPLSELSPEAVAAWLKEEVAHRPTQADLAFRLLRGFVNWAAVQRVKVEESPADKPDYRPVYPVIRPPVCVAPSRMICRSAPPRMTASSVSS